MRRRLAVIAGCVALGAGGGMVVAPAAGAGTSAPTGTEVTSSGHSPGQPINSKRCRKLIRKIKRADRKGKDRRVRRLSRRYNRTCRR